jgi:transposase
MEVIHLRCAGLDVHQETVVSCIRIQSHGKAQHEVRTFSTTMDGLLALSDWLAGQDVTHAVLESTGVYWKPVWHVLEASVELVLANAHQVRNLPGRKTDVADAVWLADLLAHGLIRGSFVPPVQIQELRDLTRTRTQLVREVARHTQRLQKTLEDGNVKLTNVLSDVLGASGRAILRAIVNGTSDPATLAALRRGTRLKSTEEQFVQALTGKIRDHHRFLLKLHLDQVESIEASVALVEQRIGALIEPFRAEIELLTTIPGVSDTVARGLIAEIGLDMSRFPSAPHLVSWAGLCPKSDESAGKRRSTKLRKGDKWLKTLLVQAAWASTRKKDSYLRALFLRLKARRGPTKAVVAVAASILTSVYFILERHQPWKDLGLNYFDARDRDKLARRLVKRLENLGLRVQLSDAA